MDQIQGRDVLVASGQLGWQLIGTPSTNHVGVRQFIWSTFGGQATIYYTFDPTLKVGFLDFEGSKSEEAIGQAYATFPVYLPEDLRELIEPEEEEDSAMRKLARTAAAAQSNLKPAYKEVFSSGFQHRSPRVREGAAYAVMYTGQAELANLLIEVFENDSSLEVRNMAQEGLRFFEEEIL